MSLRARTPLLSLSEQLTRLAEMDYHQRGWVYGRRPHPYAAYEYRAECGVCLGCRLWPCGCPTLGSLPERTPFMFHPREAISRVKILPRDLSVTWNPRQVNNNGMRLCCDSTTGDFAWFMTERLVIPQ